jgi:hypothetical protein
MLYVQHKECSVTGSTDKFTGTLSPCSWCSNCQPEHPSPKPAPGSLEIGGNRQWLRVTKGHGLRLLGNTLYHQPRCQGTHFQLNSLRHNGCKSSSLYGGAESLQLSSRSRNLPCCQYRLLVRSNCALRWGIRRWRSESI